MRYLNWRQHLTVTPSSTPVPTQDSVHSMGTIAYEYTRFPCSTYTVQVVIEYLRLAACRPPSDLPPQTSTGREEFEQNDGIRCQLQAESMLILHVLIHDAFVHHIVDLDIRQCWHFRTMKGKDRRLACNLIRREHPCDHDYEFSPSF